MKRNENETYSDYKDRLRRDRKKLDMYLNGRQVWDSSKGGYVMKIHGKI
jgi:hypothetical protein